MNLIPSLLSRMRTVRERYNASLNDEYDDPRLSEAPLGQLIIELKIRAEELGTPVHLTMSSVSTGTETRQEPPSVPDISDEIRDKIEARLVEMLK